MDPAPLSGFEWSELGRLLTTLWLVVIFIVIFAANMLLGHNFIPSLVASQHISNNWQKTRPFFYLAAIVCFGIAMFFLADVVEAAGVLRRFWPNYWI